MLRHHRWLSTALALTLVACGGGGGNGDRIAPPDDVDPAARWAEVKAAAAPEITPAFADRFDAPQPQPLAEFGWEDGVHISRDGLHLYALYTPADLLSWVMFIGENPDLGFCELFGTDRFIRDYATDVGVDMTTNAFGCDSFLNTEIVYARRDSTDEEFTEWTLADIEQPGRVQGGPYPLFSANNPELVEFFLFTRDNDIWLLRNTTPNPSGVGNAQRLPFPINPPGDSDEFNADNPHLERLPDERLLLVYERYTDAEAREFMLATSSDNAVSWSIPEPMTSITPAMGRIEHPHLRRANGEWYLWFSLECTIVRTRQQTPGDFDSWGDLQTVVLAGDTACVGEPSLTDDGDLSFTVVFENPENDDPDDTFDIDPWHMRRAD